MHFSGKRVFADEYLLLHYPMQEERMSFFFFLSFALPVNQQGNSGAHQQNGAGHADGSPVPMNNGFEHLADKQKTQTGGDALRNGGTAEFWFTSA